MSTTVNKKEFADMMAEKGDIYKKEAFKAVGLFWETLLDYLAEGRKVNFYGIGHFELKTVKEREARNPKTGETCIAPEHQKVKFYSSETLTDKMEME